MKRNLLWKFLFVVFVLVWAIWELYPPQARDLVEVFASRAQNRDTNFTAIVEQARQLEKENPERSYSNLRQAIGNRSITNYFPWAKVAGENDPTRAVLNRLQREAAGRIRLGLDLQGGTSFLVEVDSSQNQGDTNRVTQTFEKETMLSQAAEVLRKRVDKFGVAEPIIQPVGDNRILIQLPGLTESEKQSARAQIEKAAFLEFRLVHPESDRLVSQGLGAPGYELLKTKRRTADGREAIQAHLVKKKAEMGLTGAYVKQAMVVPEPISNRPGISLAFDSRGAEIFAQVTRQNVGRQLAIVLDGELYSAPVIQQAITGGSASITGDFSLKEAYELANVLENPLAAPVKITQEYSVEPSLGNDSIRSGIRACLIGTIAVSAFMLIYYLFAGLVANVALLLNVIILLGVMCSIETTLTMPGIAGIVLTLGMAVDANVLIYERLKEELAAGKSLRGALAAAYDRAFGTILDSNITTLISSIILIFLGTGPVQGFGVTLSIGIAVSMFTALVVTRLIFDWLIDKGWLQSLNMLSLIGKPKIDFLKWSKIAFALSWTLGIIGVAYGFYRGKATLGVDFAGGDRITMTFAQKVPVEQVRDTVGATGVGESFIQYQKDISSGRELLQITGPFESGGKIQQALKEKFPSAKFDVIEAYNVGGTVGQQILKTAIIAVLLSLLGILIYVAMRYEFSFALAAVVAIVHDVFMTIGWFCLTGREFSAPMIAAILTIIGFSINDTIVIFDRIREDLKLGMRGSFAEIINHALNQTLSRTIITSGTLFLATLALYIFGGPVINDFAFTFLVGVLVGTYSSIYIASAFVLWWHKGERPKMATSQVAIDNAVTARV